MGPTKIGLNNCFQRMTNTQMVIISDEVRKELGMIQSVIENVLNPHKFYWLTSVPNIEESLGKIYWLSEAMQKGMPPIMPQEEETYKSIADQLQTIALGSELLLSLEKRKASYNRACAVSFLGLLALAAYSVLHRNYNLFNLSTKTFTLLTLIFAALSYCEKNQTMANTKANVLSKITGLTDPTNPTQSWPARTGEGQPSQQYQSMEYHGSTNSNSTYSGGDVYPSINSSPLYPPSYVSVTTDPSSSVSSQSSQHSHKANDLKSPHRERAVSPGGRPTRALPTPSAPSSSGGKRSFH